VGSEESVEQIRGPMDKNRITSPMRDFSTYATRRTGNDSDLAFEIHEVLLFI
jgi:hypothetical protein